MLFTCLNHQLNKNQNLGFFPSRLVYEAEVPDVARDVKREVRDVEGEQTAYETARGNLKEKRDIVVQRGNDVGQAILDFQKSALGDIDWFEGFDSLGEWKKTYVLFEIDKFPPSLLLQAAKENLAKLKKDITRVRKKIPKEITQNKYDEENFEDYQHNLQHLLNALDYKIELYEKALTEAATAAQAYETVLQGHGQNLTSRHELMMDHVEIRTGFEAEPVYQRLEGKFDLALRDPELSALGDRQMRQLFFSILGQNTKGFKDTVNEGFLVGQGFGNNWQENRKNFPFLYNEWLKNNNVNAQEVAAAETVVRAKEDLIKALREDGQPITSVEELIAKETSGTGNEKLIKDTALKALGAPPPLDEDLLTYHRDREDVIYNLQRQYLELAGKTEDASNDPKANKAKAGDYRQRADKLELFIDLEAAKVRLYEWKTKNDAKETFTREHLTNPNLEPWLLEVAMHQFVRAANMIDYPDGKQSASQADIYHPAVRRMMIAMMYREGTAKWSIPSGTDRGTPDGKYDDNVVDEYSGMLSELAKSNDFNINLRGKFFLNEQARTYLLLSRYSNLIRLRIPGLEKEVETITGVFDATKKTNVNDKLGVNLDDPALTFDAAKTALEAKLIALVDAELKKPGANPLKTAKDKIEPFRAALTAFPGPNSIDIDAANPETEKTKAENVLIKAANDDTSTDLQAFSTANRDQQLQMGINLARNQTGTPAAAAAAMLEYIGEFKKNKTQPQKAQPGTNEEKLTYARRLAISEPTSEAALAFQTLDYITKREVLRLYEEDTNDIDKFIQDPNHIAIRGIKEFDRAAFLAHLRSRPSPEGPTENEAILTDWTNYSQAVELNYDLFDTQEKSKMDYMDRLGINIEGCYQQYLNYIKANPEMRVDQWEKYLHSDKPEEFEKLLDLFRTIIPEGEGGGKLDFLITLENWHKTEGRGLTPENTKQQSLALSIYHGLKAEMEHREAIAAASARGEQEVVAKLEGMNIGEKISKYGEGVLNLLIGPGQSWTNRAAGMVIAYGAWKAARMAMKGEGKTGKGLRVLFMLGAAEIATKEITGRGLLDRSKLFDTMGEAIEGTYEAVLVQQGIEGINEEQHTAALYELNTVPFHAAMEWYEKTDVEGNPLPGQESDRLWKAMKVDVDRVRANRKVEWAEADELREAKRIVKKTMEQFFGYVATKDNETSANHGKEALKERWIRDTQDKAFTLDQAQYTKFLHPELTDQFHGNQNALTWQMVMRAEIDTADVEATNRQNWKDRVADYASGKLADLERWGRQDVLGWLGPAAANFWYELGVKADEVKTWLGEMGEAGATKLHFGKQYVEYWYEGNKHTIRRFLDDHIELVVDGLKLPFAIIYGADQMIVPWATTKIRQIQEILRDDKLTSTKGQGPLQLQDIMTLPITTAGRDLRDVSKNPEYRYFGEYQKSFAKAFSKPGKFEVSDDPKDAFHYRIGYHISPVTKEDVGYAKGTTPAEIMLKMQEKSWEKARAEFIKQGGPQEQVDKLMYPVHVIVQKGTPGAEEVPERMYVFWRMPMPGSMEYMLKTAPGNRWTDYMDPNKHKDRPPVLFDPKLGLVENLEQALGLKLEGTREVAGVAGLVFSQALKFPMWTGETAGEVVAFVPGLFSKDTAKWIQEVSSAKEDKKEWLDEKLTSAYSTDYAISKFYQDPVNAWWYRAALDYARDTQRDVWLGNPDLQWKGSRQKNILMDQPSDFNPNDFKVWLKNTQAKNHPPPKGVTLPK